MRRTLSIVLGLAAAAGALIGVPAPVAASPSGDVSSWPADAMPGTVLVTAVSEASALALAGASDAVHGRVVAVAVAPGSESAAARRLALTPGVVAAEPDHRRAIARIPNDPELPRQWAHVLSRTTTAWDTTVGSRAVRVGIIDVGIDGRHPDLAANLVAQYDVSGAEPVPVPVGTDNDPCQVGHGTEVAGIVGAAGDDGSGIAGVAWQVGLVDLAAGDRDRCGTFDDASIVAGLDLATDLGLQVVNMSLGSIGDACPTSMQAALDAARAAGVVVVAAAGNENRTLPGATSIPASCNGVLSVAAVGDTGAVASYSNVNDWVDLAAPGGDVAPSRSILTTARGGGLVEHRGTSYAAPYVAGVVALLRTVRPGLTPDEVEAVLEGTTIGRPAARSNQLGWGVVDAGAAVALVASGQALPALSPSRPFPVGLVARVAPGDGITDPERQAVAMSVHAFAPTTAHHAVVARDDDYADALAGSSLGFGHGPVLFTPPTGALPDATRSELVRVLRPGATVYVLGGTLAVPAGVEAEIAGLGFVPRRLAGEERSATAAAVSQELQRLVPELGWELTGTAIVVTANNWPDAATSGALGSWYGMPILLSAPSLPSSATTDELRRLAPTRILVVGGTDAVSDQAFLAIAGAAPGARVDRLAGADRVGTGVAVAREMNRLFRAENGFDVQVLVAVNLRRADAFPHLLSATDVIGSQSGVFLPIEGERGDVVPAATRQLICSLDASKGIVAGGADILSSATKDTFTRLLERTERC
jgi:subtilisin family serine protease